VDVLSVMILSVLTARSSTERRCCCHRAPVIGRACAVITCASSLLRVVMGLPGVAILAFRAPVLSGGDAGHLAKSAAEVGGVAVAQQLSNIADGVARIAKQAARELLLLGAA
jgi:hypothetical protein